MAKNFRTQGEDDASPKCKRIAELADIAIGGAKGAVETVCDGEDLDTNIAVISITSMALAHDCIIAGLRSGMHGDKATVDLILSLMDDNRIEEKMKALRMLQRALSKGEENEQD